MKHSGIRVVAICVFHRNGRILIFDGFDAVKGTHYYRPLLAPCRRRSQGLISAAAYLIFLHLQKYRASSDK